MVLRFKASVPTSSVREVLQRHVISRVVRRLEISLISRIGFVSSLVTKQETINEIARTTIPMIGISRQNASVSWFTVLADIMICKVYVPSARASAVDAV